ncbi:tRNA (guanosine(37)-N1)-methyltransferase TrmD [Halalkalibacter sp. APA_J-10(15)]|uniref:tRNA (guanosine(37)-N1)-methyltransferase TrmD n=1 Tax=Halalkalibacter sp. APA_J-10(15) TaxID=2933805 RepID=UPI001FF609DD|nr:tRNA (guanosine(37)-N1)-methyltransferase TrmD [Halalkalibacter sp. APA_J-10(15)]MCK0470730.1 tRNA (guanosine(37)-N1)-methyltransferase TrmD [Halalkalibacter sp. APA_J-10(15)]
MKIDILTLFPEMFDGVFETSILKKAQQAGIVSLNTINYRHFANDKHQKVDDYPYGGGAGMVLKPQPIFDAIEHVKQASEYEQPHVVLLCPQGEPYTQSKAEQLTQKGHLIFICGHYEGYDERIREHLVDEEISIGDYVLTGGEIGAMAMTDSIVRLLPGVLGNSNSALLDSFSTGLLEHPQYTRPANFRGNVVPDILLSGHHERIEEWRRKEALKRTWSRRPDLLKGKQLNDEEKKWIREFSQKKDESS